MLIVIAGISLIHKNLFNLYTEISMYLMLLASFALVLLDKKVSRRFLLFGSVFIIYLVGSVFYNGGGFGSLVTVLLFLLMLYNYTKLDIESSTHKLLKSFFILLIIYLFAISFMYAKDFYYYRYNAINQNTMGMFVIYSFMAWYALTNINTFRKKIGTLAILLIALLALFNYSSRGSTIALLFYVVLNVVFRKGVSRKAIMTVTIFIIICGMAFPFVYLILYRSNINFLLFGKSLYTGREAIWNNMFNALNQGAANWLFGLGSKATLWTGHSLNVHNDFFAILVNFGAIGLVLYYGFLITFISRIASVANQNLYAKKLLFMYLASVLMLGCFEVTTLWIPIYPMVCFSLGGAYNIYLKTGKKKEILAG